MVVKMPGKKERIFNTIPYCNIQISIFFSGNKEKGRQARDKLQKFVEENFADELTMDITYPF